MFSIFSSSGETSGQSRAERLEQLAAKRRAELQRLASQHQSSGAPPTNITPQQAGERQQAKTLYERRAEALRQMQQQQGRSGQPSSPQTSTYTQAPPTRSQSVTPKDSVSSQEHPQTIAASNRKREVELSKVREREEQMLRQREAQLKKREEHLRQKAAQLGRGASQVSHEQHGDLQMIHRHVDDVLPVPSKPRGTSVIMGNMKLDRNALRKAIILKEILDPPVALRQAESGLS